MESELELEARAHGWMGGLIRRPNPAPALAAVREAGRVSVAANATDPSATAAAWDGVAWDGVVRDGGEAAEGLWRASKSCDAKARAPP